MQTQILCLSKSLKNSIFANFDSYLRYECQVCQISRLQYKALKEISFKDRNTAAGPLYNEKKIIRFFNLVTFYNCLYIAGHLNQHLPSSLEGILLTWLTAIIITPGGSKKVG